MPGGMYGGGMPQATSSLPQNVMQQGPADIDGQRDRITQALMDVQNPPPVTPMGQQQGMPAATGAMPMASAMPGAAAPQPMGTMPGQLPVGGGMPGQMPLVGQGGAMPGLQAAPGLQTAPGLMQQPRTPGGSAY